MVYFSRSCSGRLVSSLALESMKTKAERDQLILLLNDSPTLVEWGDLILHHMYFKELQVLKLKTGVWFKYQFREIQPILYLC